MALAIYKFMKAKIIIRKGRGLPWHYHHFVTDALLPFFRKFIRPNNNGLTDVYFKDIPAQSIGTFTKHFEQFLGVKAHLIPPQEFKELQVRRMQINSMTIRPFKQYPQLFSYIEKLGLKDESYPKILLIERAVQKLPHFSGLKTRQNKTGAERRTIGNHDELRTALEPYGAKNLVLENIPFLEQIKYFYNAHTVIGQHGAGLSNMVWMQGGRVIELISRKSNNIRFWRRYLKNKNLVWKNIVFPSNGHVNSEVLQVNPKMVIQHLGG